MADITSDIYDSFASSLTSSIPSSIPSSSSDSSSTTIRDDRDWSDVEFASEVLSAIHPEFDQAFITFCLESCDYDTAQALNLLDQEAKERDEERSRREAEEQEHFLRLQETVRLEKLESKKDRAAGAGASVWSSRPSPSVFSSKPFSSLSVSSSGSCWSSPSSFPSVSSSSSPAPSSSRQSRKFHPIVQSGALRHVKAQQNAWHDKPQETAPLSDLTSKLRLDKINELFPTLDVDVVKGVYYECGENMTEAIRTLKHIIGDTSPFPSDPPLPPSSSSTSPNLAPSSFVIDGSVKVSVRGAGKEDSPPRSSLFAERASAADDSSFSGDVSEIHARIEYLHRIRDATYRSAASAKGEEARQLWRRGEVLSQEITELKETSLRKRIESNNKSNGDLKLDLHGLYVNEALQVLKDRIYLLKSREERVELQVITGVGSHSLGKARILPAVQKFLEENSYSHRQEAPGVFVINLNTSKRRR